MSVSANRNAQLEKFRKTLDYIGQSLSIKSFEDWYTVKITDVVSFKGSSTILEHYNNSLMQALTNVFSEYPWKMWKFEKAPQRFWTTRSNQLQYIKWLETQLNIHDPQDWYNVTFEQVAAHSGRGLLQLYNNSVAKMVTSLVPFNWEPWKFKVHLSCVQI